jgi:hypothetical protein
MPAKCDTWGCAKLRHATRLIGSKTAKLAVTFDAYTAAVQYFDGVPEIVIVGGRDSGYGVQSPRPRSETQCDSNDKLACGRE